MLSSPPSDSPSPATPPRAAVQVAVVQMAMSARVDDNLGRAGELLGQAALAGAQIILLPELFASEYFPREIGDAAFKLAEPRDKSRVIAAMQVLAATHQVVVPVSYFEHDVATGKHYNSVAMIDADGTILGHYRKSHIPDGPGYEEKHFFAPGDTGFMAFDTRFGRIGVGICWDQWFPECARAMTLLGAELLLYPSAIGTEPLRPTVDTSGAWRRVMLGHAVANTIPIAASNRVGLEGGQRYYGTSFIADGRGEILSDLQGMTGFTLASIDLAQWNQEREWMALLRDRRPELYGGLVK
jgi:N-carbamoylputrescine amidase